MILATFHARLHERLPSDTGELMAEIDAELHSIEGFLWTKNFTSEDGEVVTIAHFSDARALESWRSNRIHQRAISRWSEFMSWYRIDICDVTRRIGPHGDEPDLRANETA